MGHSECLDRHRCTLITGVDLSSNGHWYAGRTSLVRSHSQPEPRGALHLLHCVKHASLSPTDCRTSATEAPGRIACKPLNDKYSSTNTFYWDLSFSACSLSLVSCSCSSSFAPNSTNAPTSLYSVMSLRSYHPWPSSSHSFSRRTRIAQRYAHFSSALRRCTTDTDSTEEKSLLKESKTPADGNFTFSPRIK